MVVEFCGNESANCHPVSRVLPRPVNTVFEVFGFSNRVVKSMLRQEVLIISYVRYYFRFIATEEKLAREDEIEGRIQDENRRDQAQPPAESIVSCGGVKIPSPQRD